MAPPKTIRSLVADALRSEGFEERVITSAMKKADRWMRKAYGIHDWNRLAAATGDPVTFVRVFCRETIADPTGFKTFNQLTRRRRP